MSNYEKPIAIVAGEAEGIYAASGAGTNTGSAADASNTSAGATYSLEQTNAWDGNKQYDITFTNNSSEKVDSVTVTVKVKGTVTSIGGNVTGVLNGEYADITFNNYGNAIEAGATVGPIYMAVTGTGDFSLE